MIENTDNLPHRCYKTGATVDQPTPEEDHCALPRAAAARQEAPPRENLVALARRQFGPERGVNLDIPPCGSAQPGV